MPDTIQGLNGGQPQGEGQLPAATPTAIEPQVSLDADEKEALENSKNPERTASYIQKLKDKLKEKEDKVTALESSTPRQPSALETYLSGQVPMPLSQQMPPMMPQTPPMNMVQTNLPQGKAEAIRQELIDRDGYVNADEFERRLKSAEQAEQRAREAESRANQALERVARFEADAQKSKARQLYQEFPELDPSNDTYSREYSEAVVDEMLLQIVKTGQQDPIIAAEKLKNRYRKPTVSGSPTPAQQSRAQALVSPRAQARPSASNRLNTDELRTQSLHNNKAMEERIKRAGI